MSAGSGHGVSTPKSGLSSTFAPRVGLYLSGASGNYVITPDSATFDTTDLDVRVLVHLEDWTPAAQGSFASRWSAAGQRSWRFDLTTGGGLRVYLSTDGTAETALAQYVITPEPTGPVWVRFTLDADNGAGGYDVKYWRSADGASWTQVGSTITGGAPIAVFGSASGLEVGASTLGTGTRLPGIFLAATVRGDIDGTPVAAWDGSWPHTRQRDDYGNIWTVNGTANAWQVL